MNTGTFKILVTPKTYISEAAAENIPHVLLQLVLLVFVTRCRRRALADDMLECDAHLDNHHGDDVESGLNLGTGKQTSCQTQLLFYNSTTK